METQTEENTVEEDYTEIEIPYNLYQYLSSEQCNFHTLCRICFSTDNEVMYPLITPKEHTILAIMLTDLTSMEFVDDGLPSNICEACQVHVLQCYEFKHKCVKSNCLLKSIIKFEYIAKEEPKDVSIVVKAEAPENVNENEVKQEDDPIEDVQYLEEFIDGHKDSAYDHKDDQKDKLLKLQNKRKRKIKKANISITDSKRHKEIVLNKTKAKTKRTAYRCPFCSEKFSKHKTFQEHLCDAQQPHPCSQCKYSFNSEHDLLIHSAVHNKGPVWKCNVCHKEYNGKHTFQRHIKRHMTSKRHSCESCGKTFTELYALRRHVRVHTGQAVEKKHACHICDKRYSASCLLAAHLSRHMGLRPCKCTTCGKTFPSRRLLASHALVHTDKKPYACDYCDRLFRHESSRNTHHRTHTGEKPYVCAVCGKTFIQNSNLTLHMRTHTGEKPYTCSVCDRKFASGSSLNVHKKVHTGERPCTCDICGKKFTRRNLISHLRLHASDRPYSCAVCPKKFTKASHLRDHCRIHTGEKPFECSVCQSKYANKATLRKHLKIHAASKRKRRNECEPCIPANVIYEQKDAEIQIEHNGNDPKNIFNTLKFEVVHTLPLEVTGELIVQDIVVQGHNTIIINNS